MEENFMNTNKYFTIQRTLSSGELNIAYHLYNNFISIMEMLVT